MLPSTNHHRVLVTGGGTFLGTSIAAALLAEGAEVTILVRPGAEGRLGALANRVRWYSADTWDPASLRGRARGHGIVVHTVGSMIDDPAHGLTYHRLNVVSARNVANMCVSDGVTHMVLLSAVYAPWISHQYVRAKREAESYLRRVGLQHSVIRAPLVYVRGGKRPLFYRFTTLLGSVPPVSWLGMNRIAPMPLDYLARGVARVALERQRSKVVFYAPDLRKRVKRSEPVITDYVPEGADTTPTTVNTADFAMLDDDMPFGWSPDKK